MWRILLEKNREEFLQFIDAMSDAVFVMKVEDEEFTYAAVNKAGIQLAGFPNDIFGKTLAEAVPPDAAAILYSEYRGLVYQQKPSRFEFHSEARGTYEESLLTPITDDNGRVNYIITVTRDITERKKVEKKQELAEQKFASLVTLNTAGVFEMDEAGRVIQVNAAMENLTGYSEADLVNDRIRGFFIEGAEELFAGQVLQQSGEWHVTGLRCDGEVRECHLKTVPIIVDEELFGAFGVVEDVTKDRELLRAIKQSEEKYSRLIEESPDAMLIHCGGYIEFANQAAATLLDAPNKEWLFGKSVYDFHAFGYRALLERELCDLVNGEIDRSFEEETVVTASGRNIEVEVGKVRVDYKAKEGIHSTIRDVSKRKHMENALKESEEKYRLIAEHSTDLIQLADTTGVLSYVSPSHEKILHTNERELKETLVFSLIDEDHRELFYQLFMKALRTGVNEALEVKMHHPEKQWIWVYTDLLPIRGEDDRVEQMLVVGEDITKRKEHEAKIHYMAFHDGLTGLANRELFESELKKAAEKEPGFTLMYIDCDDFKSVNDEKGHAAGDHYLVTVADRLTHTVRNDDLVARIGGDEFVVLIRGLTDQRQIDEIARRIVKSMETPWVYEGETETISISIGIAVSFGEHDHGDVLRRADSAMYQAKKQKIEGCRFVDGAET
ncbi:PAS domain S-box protein [Salisediminibacterium halotolerans]|uniref:PAS domain S-box protein n=1 Tax=Salisediminibacterium halotolerans TaxID=517425 RepID=UPI000EB3ADB3|nr:PAS domain S-box protein [Salisediminibacterium halotolerans]RLJ71674.1 PAS domain S-box-containing protein/diguanylate cyclase (GGDEF)-like protein [Actinophytocola xinjiangensis]RPE86824.1 PAS domain S-box-containing protein/diguanylate cyclase (GGDEF)-like protein [Salisediminibacterium halotolerans]TWG32887.1 diguanylate cyclase with PAS/PAC sensor [Salisediminibacterium halotolerans]GEL06979.1 hypothetical protein SHA02_03950 [Salisediminibacterium halotolerans]